MTIPQVSSKTAELKSSDHNRLIICTSPVGSEASHKVSLNSHNKLLRNSSDKNCTICTMENFKGPLLCEKSSDQNRLIICTSPVGSEASHKVSLKSRNKLLRNSSDKNCGIRTIAPTDNRSYAKFDRADSRSYDLLTGRTVTPTMFWQGGQSLLHYFDNPDSGFYYFNYR